TRSAVSPSTLAGPTFRYLRPPAPATRRATRSLIVQRSSLTTLRHHPNSLCSGNGHFSSPKHDQLRRYVSISPVPCLRGPAGWFETLAHTTNARAPTGVTTTDPQVRLWRWFVPVSAPRTGDLPGAVHATPGCRPTAF